jgi:hypothetical protein
MNGAMHNAAMTVRAKLFVLVACLAALGSGPAAARPRDDVMSGAFRCAAIGESRLWLDCYYGAAQPVRAALNLPPASAAQLKLAAAPPAAAPDDIPLRDAVMGGASGCMSLADERSWLNCYYAAAQPMRERLGLSPAPQAAASQGLPARGAPVAPPYRQSGTTSGLYGLDKNVPAMPENVDHITARMASYSFAKTNFFTVILDNGQVWEQIDGDTSYARWKKAAASYVVRISHGFLGSYNLQVQGNPGLYKVRRVK